MRWNHNPWTVQTCRSGCDYVARNGGTVTTSDVGMLVKGQQRHDDEGQRRLIAEIGAKKQQASDGEFVTLTADSGVAETMMSVGGFEMFPTMPTKESQVGMCDIAANGKGDVQRRRDASHVTTPRWHDAGDAVSK